MLLARGGSCAKPVRNGAKLLEVTHSSTQPATVTCWAVRNQGLKSRKFAGFCTLDIILYLLSLATIMVALGAVWGQGVGKVDRIFGN